MAANNDFLDIYKYKDAKYPFQIFIGGRGTGKTYSALEGGTKAALASPSDSKMIWMRRTNTDYESLIDTDKGETGNPYKQINKDKGWNFGIKAMTKNMSGIYHREYDEEAEKWRHIGQPIGYAMALTTVARIKGFDFSDCSDWFYDEFVREKHQARMSGEVDAVLNGYESICRNREFFGREPLRLWFLSNSTNIYNEVFVGLGIVAIVEKMSRQGKHDKYLPDRGLAIHLLESTESFIKKKKETALYKLTKGTKYYDMALNNAFAYDDFSLVEYRKTNGYAPVCAIDYAYVYRRKGDGEYYVSYQEGKCVKYSSNAAHELIAFKQKFGFLLVGRYTEGKVYFESYDLKSLVLGFIM